jgi:hypothetical protein
MKAKGCFEDAESRRVLYDIVAKPPWISSDIFAGILELANNKGETEHIMNQLARNGTMDQVLCRIVGGVVEANEERERVRWLNWLTSYYRTNGWGAVPPLQETCLAQIHAIYPQADISPALVHDLLETCRPNHSDIALFYLAVLYKLHLPLSSEDLHLIMSKIPFSTTYFWMYDLRPIIKDQAVLEEYQKLISEKKILPEGDSIAEFVQANCNSMVVAGSP